MSLFAFIQMREDYYAGLEDRHFLDFENAKEQKKKIDFDCIPPAPCPNKLGITVVDTVSLQDVVPYIDWVCLLLLIMDIIPRKISVL